MSYSEEEWKADLEVTKRVLKDTYVNNIIYVQERMKDNAKEEELKQIDDLILANERMIVYFDEDDKWVKELHEQAQGNEDGTTIEGTIEDDDAEATRIEEARNS